jgi:hypothetical protein
MGKRVWTEETRTQVRDWFTKHHLSYGQIAHRLGVSRDVVAGLCNRLGLAGQGRTQGRGGWAARKTDEPSDPSPLIELGRTCCAWPVGDPKKNGFRFCGQPIDGRGPYCSGHRKLAYSPPEPRKRERDVEAAHAGASKTYW